MINEELLVTFQNNLAAIDDEGKTISYLELKDFSEQLYERIGHRCLVFVLCKNDLGSFSGYVSFICKQIVPLLLDASLEKDLLQQLLEKYGPEFVWLPSEKITDYPSNKIVFEAFGYALLRFKETPVFPMHDELALLFTTSGSTGSPKLVRISYENINSNAEAIAEYLSLSENERPITVLPMNYSYGLSVINSHLLKGATILLTAASIMQKEFWAFLKNEKATSFSGVPYTYEMLYKLRFFRMDLPFLKTLTQAGGKLNDDLVEQFAKFCEETGKRFFVMYGQTEATARMAYLPPEYAIEKKSSIGKAIPGGELSLLNEQGELTTQNEVAGELIYRGKNVSMGYATEGADLCKPGENNGVLNTHDIAKRDSEGFYYIIGRKSRFIKLFGNRVSLDETEHIIKQIVSDCACAGEDDRMVIYITDASKEKEIIDLIATITGINHKAFFVQCIETIPKNVSGKTIYSKLDIV
jgi:long-chain acyl-CoA synthetase